MWPAIRAAFTVLSALGAMAWPLDMCDAGAWRDRVWHDIRGFLIRSTFNPIYFYFDPIHLKFTLLKF